MVKQIQQHNGFKIFLLVVFSQTISLVGSGLTDFALAFYVLEDVFMGESSLLIFSLIFFFVYFPGMIVAPFAGTFIDRHSKKTILVLSNMIAALATLFTLIMVLTGYLQVWHIYLAAGIKSIAAAFQIPAFQACITLLVDKADYGKANGFSQMGESLHRVVSPLIAGTLFSVISIHGIMMIDLLCFMIGIGTLFFIRIPGHVEKEQGQETLSFWQQTVEGYRFFQSDKGLKSLLIFFVISNFLIGFVHVWVQPLVFTLAEISSTAIDKATALGTVMTSGGVGMMVGSIAMGIWGGPKNKVKGVLIFTFLGGFIITLAALIDSLIIFTIGAFLYFLTIPFILGCNLAIWQRRVPAAYQGRVFSLRRASVLGVLPLSFILAGLIGDWVEPMLHASGVLAPYLGPIVGVGTGHSYIFLFSTIGLFSMGLSIIGLFSHTLKTLEAEELAENDVQQGKEVSV
ncbi:MFS transporter [Caldalkalibacillus salinus]|uniref:MFS transporter n=1 Tax=Caldalkalibacillus salinus TaxID=2803787 RepID=UPI0019227D09|nr:MFS transporter [Caldalkalibacillus salinus]